MPAGLVGFDRLNCFDGQYEAGVDFGYRLGVVRFGEAVVAGKEVASKHRSA